MASKLQRIDSGKGITRPSQQQAPKNPPPKTSSSKKGK
jgi:hypothetical protein